MKRGLFMSNLQLTPYDADYVGQVEDASSHVT